MTAGKYRTLIARVPEGSSYGVYRGRKYALSKRSHNGGRSCKIYAEQLGGSDFISLNFYQTQGGDLIKPCEMPEQKVVDFLREVDFIA